MKNQIQITIMNNIFILFLTIFLIIISTQLKAQAPEIEWQNTIGGSSGEYNGEGHQTSDGGYILGGSSTSGISGDKTEENLSDFDYQGDYWVVKLDSLGSIEWQKTIGGSGDEYLSSIQQTDDGGYILGGYSDSDISGNKTDASCFIDYWVVKLDNIGEIEWQNTLGGCGDDFLNSIQQTFDGGFILGGSSDSDGDYFDYLVIKLNSSGEFEWQSYIGGNTHDELRCVWQTTDEGYILGGDSESNISGDKTEASLGGNDYWVVKLSASGNIEWQNTIGGNSSEYLTSVQQTSDGGYILSGGSESGISGDKTEENIGSSDYWVVKLDSSGGIEWQNTIGGNSYDSGAAEQTLDGGYILSGESSSGISGDKTEENIGSSDYWVVKLDSSGGIEWQNTIGGNSSDYGTAEQTLEGGYILSGESSSGISGDKTENNIGDRDYWVVKLEGNCFVASSITPGGATEFCKPGSVTLNATVDAGYTYQWKKNGMNITGATSDNYVATKSGNYQVEINNGACNETSDSILISVYNKPNATITNLFSNDLCVDPSIKLRANEGSALTYQWYKDGTIITGATGNIYFATGIGNYKVKVASPSGCNKLSDTYPIINSCRILDDYENFSIYPNPAKDEFAIEFTSTDLNQQQVIISITNILGEEVLTKPSEMISGKLSQQIIFNQPSGVYIIKILAGGDQYEKKIMIE